MEDFKKIPLTKGFSLDSVSPKCVLVVSLTEQQFVIVRNGPSHLTPVLRRFNGEVLSRQQAVAKYPSYFRLTDSYHKVSVPLTQSQYNHCRIKGLGKPASYIRKLIDKDMNQNS